MGALSVLVFHQGTVHLLFHYANSLPWVTSVIGRVGGPGWDLSRAMAHPPMPGLIIPAFTATLLWGGLWGIVIAAVIRWTPLPDLLTATLIGAIGFTLVGVTLVAQMRGVPLFAAGDTKSLLRAALVNAAFGFGTGLLLRPLGLQEVTVTPTRNSAPRPPPPLRRR
jgi:hypothetical protein